MAAWRGGSSLGATSLEAAPLGCNLARAIAHCYGGCSLGDVILQGFLPLSCGPLVGAPAHMGAAARRAEVVGVLSGPDKTGQLRVRERVLIPQSPIRHLRPFETYSCNATHVL